MNTKSFNFFDKLIARYRLSVVVKYIEKNDMVLDLGCGVQHYLLDYGKNKFKAGYGLDYDIENCQKENLTLINHKCQGDLPLKDDFFDKVFLLAVLEHIEEKDVAGLFKEFYRVLKKGGRLIMTTPTPWLKPILEFLALKLKIFTSEEVTDHKHYYIAEEIRDLAAASGLCLTKVSYFQLGLNCLYVLEK